MPTHTLYRPSLGLLTDLYELTMAHGYWKTGLAQREAVFNLFFRENPFGGGYTVACGLADVVELLEQFGFDDQDLGYLSTLRGADGQPLFEPAFLEHLARLRLSCDIDAIAEGTAVFPNEPLLRVQGPLIEAQILESPLLNIINFQTLIATKAARVCSAAGEDPVLEFGLRRAQGIDGALAASRAAYIGGCAATSNVLAGRLLGIPVSGTHAHSWVMLFDSEIEAFEAYAEAMPNNCTFLVDTYDSLQGIDHAIEVGRRLSSRGHELLGIRLDSGDLAFLSDEARRRLDAAGFTEATIAASSDLDERIITSLKQQGAKINVWGVGTRLVTGHEQPALGGVYKLAASRDPGGSWRPKIKLSEQAAKISTPGRLQVRRFSNGPTFVADMIYEVDRPLQTPWTIVDPTDITRRRLIPAAGDPDPLPFEELLQPLFRRGKRVAKGPDLAQIRHRTREQMAQLHAGIKRFVNPHSYPVGLEKGLHRFKTEMILAARGLDR